MNEMGNTLKKIKKRRGSKSSKPAEESDSDKEDFRFINGRRYHNAENSNYILPNDDEECDRLHTQHFVLKHAYQGNFAAPVELILNGKYAKVLDSACGVGSWSFDMATHYPHVEFTGIDISPIQPSQIKPENFTFIQANLLDGLPFEDDTFDYVFQRLLVSSLPTDKWPTVIRELIRVLKPGGYLELVELNPLSENSGPTSLQFGNALVTLHEQSNFDTNLVRNLQYYCEEQEQLVDIVREEDRLVCGGNGAGKLGLAFNDDMMQFYENVETLLGPIMQVTSEEYKQMVKTTREEWLENNTGIRFVRVYARKV